MSLIYYITIGFLGLFFILESKFKVIEVENSISARKKYIIINWGIGIIVLILLAANRTGYDSKAYQRFFSFITVFGQSLNDYTYIFFGYLVYFVRNIFPTITYFEFQALICGILGYVAIKRLMPYILSLRIVLFLYLISGTIALDGLQFKNFIAVLFLLIAFPCLLQQNKKLKNTVEYTLLIIIASMFHFSFIIYCFFVLFIWIDNVKMENILKKMVVIGVVTFWVLFLFSNFLPGILASISKISILRKLSNYAAQFSGKRAIVPMVIYLFQIGVMYFCKKKNYLYPQKIKKFVDIVWLVNLELALLLPALLYANAAFRLFRNLYLVNFIVYSNFIVRLPRLSYKRIVVSIVVLILGLFIMVYPNILLNQKIDIIEGMLNGKFFLIR